MIPETYVADLQLRLGLYRRLADLEEQRDIEAFAAELIDRFGPLPEEVSTSSRSLRSRRLCCQANVEKVDVGPKGAVVSFRDNVFANPAGLLRWITGEGSLARVRPDQKVVVIRDWEDTAKRMKGTAALMILLARLAAEGEKKRRRARSCGRPCPGDAQAGRARNPPDGIRMQRRRMIALRSLPSPCSLRLADRLDERLGWVGAHDGIAVVDDEAGDAA